MRYNQNMDEASPKRVKALDLHQCSQLRGNSLDTEPTTRPAEASSQRQQLQEVKAMERETADIPDFEDKPPVVMQTLNDREFNSRLITRYSRNDFRRSKACLASLGPTLVTLASNKCIELSFGWVAAFKDSVFQHEVLRELVPILMVLKKMALTTITNTSLRLVLSRKLVTFKVQQGIMDPNELPSLLAPQNRLEDVRSFSTTLK